MPRTLSQPLDKRDSPGREGAAGAAADHPLDMAELVERCLGSVELAQRLVASFRLRMSEGLTELERPLQAGDAAAAAKIAHLLKGSAANVSADRLQRLLACVEEFARDNQIEEAREHLLELRKELEELNTYCDAVQSSQP
jgi:HPt (histidine-containing phosphotransfer) domain-containing protein